jgi:hypothetical protein
LIVLLFTSHFFSIEENYTSKIHPEEIAWFIQWSKEHNFVRSGTIVPYYWNFNSRKELYEAYKQEATNIFRYDQCPIFIISPSK